MDFQGLMKQAQLVQQKFHDAQEKMKASSATGTAGAGLVSVELRGTHEIAAIHIDDSLLQAGQGEVLGDLIRAAHADAHRKLEEVNQSLISEISGQLGMAGGLPNMPKFF